VNKNSKKKKRDLFLYLIDKEDDSDSRMKIRLDIVFQKLCKFINQKVFLLSGIT